MKAQNDLWAAIDDDDLEAVKSALRGDVREPNRTLLRAVQAGNADVVQAVLAALQARGNSPFDINHRHEDDNATLHTCALAEAVYEEYWDIAHQLIAAGADVNAACYRRIPWQEDSGLGGHDEVETFICWWRMPDDWLPELSGRLLPDIEDSAGATALSHAVLAAETARVRLLLDMGARSEHRAHFEVESISGRFSISAGAVALCAESSHGNPDRYARRLQVVKALFGGHEEVMEVVHLDSSATATVIDLALSSGNQDLIRVFGLTNVAQALDSVPQPMAALRNLSERISHDGPDAYTTACAELLWLCSQVLNRLDGHTGNMAGAFNQTLAELNLDESLDLTEHQGSIGIVEGPMADGSFEVTTIDPPHSSAPVELRVGGATSEAAIWHWRAAIDTANSHSRSTNVN